MSEAEELLDRKELAARNAALQDKIDALEARLKCVEITSGVVASEYCVEDSDCKRFQELMADDKNEVNDELEEILTSIKPSKRSEKKRLLVLAYIRQLARGALGAQVYPHGSYALKTYLDSSNVAISAFFSQTHEISSIQRVLSLLIETANRPRDSSDTDDKLSQFTVKDVMVTNADSLSQATISCSVCHEGSITAVPVLIQSNQVGALCETALCEHVDSIVMKDHVFKRTLLLVETWSHMKGIVGTQLLSLSFMRTVCLYVFNAFHLQIRTALQGIYRVLHLLETFQWDKNALTLYGPLDINQFVPIDSKTEPKPLDVQKMWPLKSTAPLVSEHILLRYMVPLESKSCRTREGLNVLDPVDPRRNLGSGVSYRNEYNIRKVFRQAATSFREAMLTWDRARSVHVVAPPTLTASALAAHAQAQDEVPAPAVEEEEEEDDEEGFGGMVRSSAFQMGFGNNIDGEGGLVRADTFKFPAPPQDKALEEEARQVKVALNQAGMNVSDLRRSFSELDASNSFDVGRLAPSERGSMDSSASEWASLYNSVESRGSFDSVAGDALNFRAQEEDKPVMLEMSSELFVEMKRAEANLRALEKQKEREQRMAVRPARLQNPEKHPVLSQLFEPFILRKFHELRKRNARKGKTESASSDVDLLDGNLTKICKNLRHACQFLTPNVNESELVSCMIEILKEHGSVAVGRLGSLLHDSIGNHSLPAMLKDRFGGLKRLLERHPSIFLIGSDHAFNPHIRLTNMNATAPTQEECDQPRLPTSQTIPAKGSWRSEWRSESVALPGTRSFQAQGGGLVSSASMPSGGGAGEAKSSRRRQQHGKRTRSRRSKANNNNNNSNKPGLGSSRGLPSSRSVGGQVKYDDWDPRAKGKATLDHNLRV